MEVIARVAEMQARARQWRREGKQVGFVPTMGYFHQGHLSLIRRAVQENDLAVVSVYVNPTQFGPQEDFHRYPRDLERDIRLAEEEGVHVLFAPSDAEMYPQGYQTYVEVTELTQGLCGARRPGHFRGVATVVAKLFHIVQPTRAYFGEKDYQQLRVVERMVRDLNLEVEIVPMPIVREIDGLAMSSRNVYLSPEERRAATVLYRAWKAAQEWVAQGERDALRLREKVVRFIEAEPLARVDYVEIVDPLTLEPLERLEGEARLMLAAFVGSTRLIDNGPLTAT